MRKPLMRIPYTELLAPPTVRPSNANSIPGAVAALQNFFTAPPPQGLPRSTVVLTGAGLSVSSGLADYRGVNGTYRVNKTYRPIYYHEFLSNHEARKRYWARSFLDGRHSTRRPRIRATMPSVILASSVLFAVSSLRMSTRSTQKLILTFQL